MKRPTIVVDTREPRWVADALEEFGVRIRTARLAAGDYDVGHQRLVERKRVFDMHVAIKEGRFWAQLHRLRRACAVPYLLIEGIDLDRGPLHRDSIRGACLTPTELGVGLLRANDRRETVLWLRRLDLRGQRLPARDRPLYAQRYKPRTSAAIPQAVLASVPGISTIYARALLERFGSVAAVVAASPAEWREVAGIGPVRAGQLADAFSFSCRRREKQDPST